jgi:hypothetical protein
VALEKICGRPLTPWEAWIHQIHAAGGASGSNTMVMLFVMLFVLFVRSRLVVVVITRCRRQVQENNLKVRLWV